MPHGASFEMDSSLEPWQMQPGESSLSYGAFCVYRDLGPTRTHAKAAKAVLEEESDWAAKSPTDKAVQISQKAKVFSGMATACLWTARSRAYDAAVDREKVQARMAAQREAAYQAGERHANIVLGGLAIASKYLQKIHDANDTKFGAARIEEMTIAEYLNLVTKLVPLERLVRGMDTPAENAAINDQMNGQSTRTSPEELKKIAREAAAEVQAAEPKPDQIVLEPPKE